MEKIERRENMNKLITKIVGVALGLTMAFGVGVAVGSSKEATPVHAADTTYTFTSKSWADSTNSWTSDKDGLQLTSGQGVQVSTGVSGAGAHTKSAINNITAIEFTYCTNASKGVGSISVTIGSNTAVTYSVTKTGGTTARTTSHTYSTAQSGVVTFSVTCTTNSVYVAAIKITTQNTIPTTSVDVSPESVTLAPGGTQQLTTTVLPANTTDTLSYSSNANGVATVSSSGLITAHADGTATITATSGNYSDTCVVTVETPTTPFIEPAKSSTSGYTGQNETLSFTYGNLTSTLGVSSSNTSVVTVGSPSTSAGSGTVQINFVAAGSTTVKFKDGSTELASVSVSVTASSVTITGLAAEATCYSNSTLDLGATITVTATGSMTSDVSWESDDEDIATVSASGVVTPVALGTANITVTSDDYPSATMTCEVTVATAPQKYVIDGPDNDSASNALTLANLKTFYPTTNMEVEWTAVSGSIYGSSTQAMRVGTGSTTGSATLSLVNNASIYVTKIVVNVKNYGSDSATFVVNGNVTTNTTTSATGTATDYEFNFASTDTSFTIQNVSKRIYVYRVDVYYSYKAAELSASPSSFDLAVSTSQAVTLTPANFTPSSYTAAVKSGTSLTASSVDFSGNIATVTAGVSTGVTVLTITGTEGLRTASVDITVNVTQPRNLTALTITTASDATTFKVGQTFDVGSLVITATFDSAPTTVVYSKAQGNMALLTALPEIGYEFIETDIGTVTSAEFELSVGTGTKSVSYTISVIDKDYAGVATDIGDLWDGQKVYFSNGTNAAFPKYSAGKNVTSVDATINETKGLDIGSTTAFAYTVGRVKIESTVYYTFSFDDGGDTYYIKDAGTSSDNAINKTTDTTDTTIYWTISAGTNSGQWHIVNRSNTNKPTLQVNGIYLSCYGNNQTDPYLYVVTPYSEEAVADAFTERYLHMDESVVGQCNTYYPILKPVWAAMGEFEKAALSGAPYERLQAWAAAHGEHLDSDMNIVANARINILGNVVQNGNTVAIIVVISMISVTCIGGYFFLRKRKED